MKEELISQINGLQAQISVLAAQVKELKGASTFGELYGLLRGQSETTEEEIDAVQYNLREVAQD